MVKLVKMKLSATEKVWRKEMLEHLSDNGGFIFTDFPEGVTYCFIPSTVYTRSPATYIMSVAVCNPKDRFSRKYGEFIALERMDHGESITVPASLVYALRGY